MQEIESGVGSIFSWVLIKRVENVEYYRYLFVMITKDARFTYEIKAWIVRAKAAFKKTAVFISKLGLNLRKKVVKY